MKKQIKHLLLALALPAFSTFNPMPRRNRVKAGQRLAKGAWLIMFSLLSLSTTHANPGDLDTTFAGTGKLRTGFGGGYAIAYATAVQADGKLILAGVGNGRYSQTYNYASGGDFLIARFGTNNVLDASFGDGGRVVTQVSTNYPNYESSVIQAVKVQADGKIVAAGFSYQNTNYSDFTLVRYNPDGSLDATFGTNGTGIVYTDFSQQSQINAMLIQSDSNIVVAGFIGNRTGFALARYNINGVLDASFGTIGAVTTPGTGYGANAVMEADGAIIAVGTGNAASGYPAFAVFRYTTNGVLDTTFGGTGEVFTQVSPNSTDSSEPANAVALQSGTFVVGNPDKIVIAGTTATEDNTGFHAFQTVIRYNLDGSLDTSFGSGGVATNAIIPPYSADQYCTALIVQGTLNQPRKITIGGYGNDGTNWNYFLARFTAAGALDTTFGTNSSGKILLPIARGANYAEAAAYAMVLQSGNFVLAGNWDLPFSESDFAAARFTSSGLIDTTFGSNGLVLADISDALGAQANAVAVQQDGKIVVAGASPPVYLWFQNVDEQEFALARFNSDGSLDSSFGLNGKLTTMVGSNDMAYAVAIQPDGKIVAAGSSSGQFALARYNPDGSPDAMFGNNGTTTALVGDGSDQINAIGIQADGKIVAAGYAKDSSGYAHFGVARFNTNGALDTTFGSGGQVITSISTVDEAYGAGIQTNGKIVLAGLTGSISGSSITADIAAVRYNTNGALDFSFGSLGRAQVNVGGGTLDAAYAMTIQPDGKIIVAGVAGLGSLPGPGNPGGNAFVALARFNTNGALDTSFGSSGTVITEVGAYSDYATSLALQSDGKIMVAGASQNGFYQFFAQRYNPDGSVDGSYGTGGATLLDFGSGTNEFAYALALDSSGRAVIAGDAGGLFGVTRLEGDSVANPLLRISLTTSNTVTISWPYPSTGWNLQQNNDLATANWVTPPETITNDGTNNFIVVNPPTGNLFFRLSNP